MNVDNIIFVCQKGQLELQSRILSSSIRYKLGDNVNVVAAVPHEISLLSSNTIELLRKLNVKICQIEEPSFHQYITNKNKPYLHGNKIDACRLFTMPGVNLLIDTDTIIFNEIPNLDISYNTVAGCDARGLSCSLYREGNEEKLEHLYSEFNISSIDAKYYNSGVIFYHSESNFSELWFEITHNIINNNSLEVDEKFPWADQIAFSIISALPEINFLWLSDKSFNNFHPGFKLQGKNYIHHYHNIWRVFQNRNTMDFLTELESYLKKLSIESNIFYELPLQKSFANLKFWQKRMSSLRAENKEQAEEIESLSKKVQRLESLLSKA